MTILIIPAYRLFTRIARYDDNNFLHIAPSTEMVNTINEVLFFLLGVSSSERLENELNKIFDPSISNGIKVLPPPYGADSAWFGAKLISNVS